jgi:radical SAM superfamily enzyme YgiQ (UPF0313 family)
MQPTRSRPGNDILLISCYELGHQPAGITVAAGFLRRAGFSVKAIDVSVDGFDEQKARSASFVGLSVPMHTALKLGVRVAQAVRRINPACHICFYGLYALLNADYLLKEVGDSVIGGEYEAALVGVARAVQRGASIDVPGVGTRSQRAAPILVRLDHTPPDRSVIGPLEHYARLEIDAELRLVGYLEATRGCLHTCTHCPIPPVYGGRFFAVPIDEVMKAVRELVDSGARHITFGDPDFLNGPAHALRLARAMHAEFPELTFDFTAKVEHLIKHRELMAEFASLGCIFVVSAFESLSDEVLTWLAKGHSRNDLDLAVEILESAGIEIRPSFVSFTPWTTLDDYIGMLDWIAQRGLIDHVDPVQYSIRLLVPPGSLLLSNQDAARSFGPLDQQSFTHGWEHPDPRMDELHRKVTSQVEQAVTALEDPAETFERIRELAYQTHGDEIRVTGSRLPPLRIRPPRLTEAWFC